MAVRVQTVTRGASRYVQVVEDDYSGGTRKVRLLQSFGLDSVESRYRAEAFKSAYESAANLAPQAKGDDEAERALLAAFGIILGLGILAALLSKK